MNGTGGKRDGWRAIGGVTAVFMLLAGVIAVLAAYGAGNYRVIADQNDFHVPTVLRFLEQWPNVDLRDYPVATAPGYHLLMAAEGRYFGAGLRIWRLTGAMFGVALVALTAWAASRRSAWLALPLAGSFYVLTSTVWMLPENAAWLLVAAGMLLALRARGATFYLLSAVVLSLLVFVRQSHAWVVGVTVVAAMMQPSRSPDDADDRLRLRPTAGALAGAAVAVLPAVAVLAWLISMWHGLSPPSFQPGVQTDLHQALAVGGVAPGAPGMMLATIGFFGFLLLPWLWPATGGRRWAISGGLVGFILGVLPASSYHFPLRRSGFWAIVQKLPVYYDRSPVFVTLATVGGVVAAVALARLRSRDRLILFAALAGATLAQMTTVYLWQRYYEPFVILWLILAAAAVPKVEPPPRKPWRIGGLALLFTSQLAATAYALRNTQ